MFKAILIFLLFLLCPTSLFAQSKANSAANSSAQANEVPLFEGVAKTPEQKSADQRFIDDVTKLAGSKEAAAKQLINKGWSEIQKQDLSTAIRRFNQAYLLDPNNYDIYWGLGMASSMSGDHETAEKVFAKGVAINRKDIRFLSDYGFALQQSALFSAQTKKIDPRPKFGVAQKLFEEAAALAPKAALPHSRLAVIHYFLANCDAAKAEITKSQSLGAEGLEPRFVEDVQKRCK